jgi:hypothetical protein
MGNLDIVLNLLAFLSIGLLSVIVPTYAVSVSFLGRESKRVLSQLERRRKDLAEKLDQLKEPVRQGPGVEALKKEVKDYEDSTKNLESRVRSLSATQAFFYPFFVLLAALMCSSYASYVLPTDADSALLYGRVSAGAVLLGIILMSRTILAVNQAAISPPTLAAFRVSFFSGLKLETFQRSTPASCNVVVHNLGKEMAEELVVHLYFPKGFVLIPQTLVSNEFRFNVGTPQIGPHVDYPGYSTVSFESKNLHEDQLALIPTFELTSPSQPGKYVIPVRLWEKRLGKNPDELTVEIT